MSEMGSSLIRLICPNLRCRKILSVPITARGKTVRCRSCGMRVQVPANLGAGAPQKQSADQTPTSASKDA